MPITGHYSYQGKNIRIHDYSKSKAVRAQKRLGNWCRGLFRSPALHVTLFCVYICVSMVRCVIVRV